MFFSAAHFKSPQANYNCITCLSLSLLVGQHVIHVIDKILNNKAFYGTSLVIQWFRCCLPIRGMQIQSLVREVRSHMPASQKTQTQNRNNIVTSPIKTLKIVHIKKNLKKSLHAGDLPNEKLLQPPLGRVLIQTPGGWPR